MLIKRIGLLIITIFGICACVTPKNLNSDGENMYGSGYNVRKEADGKIHITTKTNFAPFVNLKIAREMWHKQATKECGSSNFEEENIREYSYESNPRFLGVVKYIITVKEGYAICGAKKGDEKR